MKKFKFASLIIFQILLISMLNNPLIRSTACSFGGPVSNYIFYYTIDGELIDTQKLEKFSVGADCSIQNAFVPSSGNTIFIEDKPGVLTEVDLSDLNWNVINEYDMDDIYALDSHNKIVNIYNNNFIIVDLILEVLEQSINQFIHLLEYL